MDINKIDLNLPYFHNESETSDSDSESSQGKLLYNLNVWNEYNIYSILYFKIMMIQLELMVVYAY